MPTVLSGWDWVLAPKMRLTASACAPKRVGVKSPFRVYSELSTLILLVCSGARKYIIIVASRTILTKSRDRLTTRWTMDCVHLRNLTHTRLESRDIIIPSFEIWYLNSKLGCRNSIAGITILCLCFLSNRIISQE